MSARACQAAAWWSARPENAALVPENSIIVGNTVLYGAIAGECYFHGVAGERFRRAQFRCPGGCRGRRRSRLRIHDRRDCRGPGQTGRNFAAGMSGGIAYVLDEAGDFRQRCNLAMVDLEPVPEEEELLQRIANQSGDLETHGLVDVQGDMTRHDAERCVQLISNHSHYTASGRARHILDNWQTYLPKFVKVMPVEYRRALQEMEVTKATGEMTDRREEGSKMGKVTGFMEFERQDRPYKPVAERVFAITEFVIPLDEADLERSGSTLHGLRHPVLSQWLPGE